MWRLRGGSCVRLARRRSAPPRRGRGESGSGVTTLRGWPGRPRGEVVLAAVGRLPYDGRAPVSESQRSRVCLVECGVPALP